MEHSVKKKVIINLYGKTETLKGYLFFIFSIFSILKMVVQWVVFYFYKFLR